RRGGPVSIPTEQLDVARARLAYTIRRGGRSFSAFVVPWRRAASGRERGATMVGVDEHGRATPVFSAVRYRPSPHSTSGELLLGTGSIGTPVGGTWVVLQLSGQIPDGATRVVLRLRDDRRVAPRFSYAGTWWTWFAADALRSRAS